MTTKLEKLLEKLKKRQKNPGLMADIDLTDAVILIIEELDRISKESKDG